MFKETASYFYNTVLDFVFPPACFYCRSFLEKRAVFCKSCLGHIIPVVTKTVEVTATKKVKVFAVADYKEPLRSLILAKGRSDIVAARQLGQLIWDMTHIKNMEFDFIVPVPLHWSRFAKRGFNQAQEMARVLSQKSGASVLKILKRVKKTEFQAGLTQDMRVHNVKDAFCFCGTNPEQYKGKRFLVVDDLMTTGSTLKAVARELYTLKPAEIMSAVGCRVV